MDKTKNKQQSDKIFSIILASNKIGNLKGLFDNLEETCASPKSFEVLIKLDQEDAEIVAYVKTEQKIRPFEIRCMVTPKGGGYYSLHHSYQRLFLEFSDPETYFLSVFTDEIRFKTQGWDENLGKYVDFFPDGVFRLRISDNKFRNYYAINECISSPENYSITSRKWYELTEGMGDVFWGVDSWHQCIEYYLGLMQTPKEWQGIFRGVPIYDFEVGGLEAGEGWEGAAMEERRVRVEEGWNLCKTYDAHQKMLRHACRLAIAIWAHGEGREGVDVREDIKLKTWLVYATSSLEDTAPLIGVSYYLPQAAYLHENMPRVLDIYRTDPFQLATGMRAWPPRYEMEQLEAFLNTEPKLEEKVEEDLESYKAKVNTMLTAANLNNMIRLYVNGHMNRSKKQKAAGVRDEEFRSIENTLFDAIECFSEDNTTMLYHHRHMEGVREFIKNRKDPHKKFLAQGARDWLTNLIEEDYVEPVEGD